MAKPKGEIAVEEVDRVRAAGVNFGAVVADAGYGTSAEFCHALSASGLRWAVGIPRIQKANPLDVVLLPAVPRRPSSPAKYQVPTAERSSAEEMLANASWRRLSWRQGAKGPLAARFAALRVRVADGEENSRGQHLPGEEAWLVGEHRTNGEKKYYLTNHSANTPLREFAATIKSRWACEQSHQQMKEELGLDHFEGRS